MIPTSFPTILFIVSDGEIRLSLLDDAVEHQLNQEMLGVFRLKPEFGLSALT